MKHISLVLALIFLLGGCSEDTPTSSSSCTGVVTAERGVSFKLNGVLFDLEEMHGSQMTSFSRNFDGSTEYEVMTDSFTDSGTTLHIELKLDWYGMSSGTHNWGNKFSDSNAYGCTIIIDSVDVGKRSMYRSISGQTSIKTYTSTNVDSLFGRFCGQVKDLSGNVAEVSDGRFYVTND
jgi:hypothetical protein